MTDEARVIVLRRMCLNQKVLGLPHYPNSVNKTVKELTEEVRLEAVNLDFTD